MKALERIIRDYGKRVSMGKKQKNRVLVLWGEVIKNYGLLDFLERLYLAETEEGEFKINIDFLVDFKIELENRFDPKKRGEEEGMGGNMENEG